MEKVKVLLIEDEPSLALIVKESLEFRGFDVILATNGIEGWHQFNSKRPDICLVDIMMPRKDGLTLVTEIRLIDEITPIIFLTAKVQTKDVLKGFEVGADDYMKKPFSIEELIVRINSIIRRVNLKSETVEEAAISIGRYIFTATRNTVQTVDKLIELSQRESDLLNLLVSPKNTLVDRKTILLKLWGDDNVFNSRSLDVYITRLRKHFNEDPEIDLVNIRGVGYKFVEHPSKG